MEIPMNTLTELTAAARELESTIADRIRKEPDTAALWQSTSIISARVRLQRAINKAEQEIRDGQKA
jgi:hypothetical protein